MSRKQVWAVALALAGVALTALVLWLAWGNRALTVTRLTVESQQLPAPFSGFRIAQVSDLHNAQFGPDNQDLLALLEAEHPDLILLTGDLVDSRRTDLEIAIAFGTRAAQIAPTYYVPGNHEARLSHQDLETLRQGLESGGVIVLENRSEPLERDGAYITLAGVYDPNFYTDYLMNDSALVMDSLLSGQDLEQQGYTVLLSHRPELLDTYAAHPVDLVFAGHAHGGQIRLPGIGGLAAPDQGLFPKYDAGLYTQEGTQMVVSRGLGNSIFPLRVNNRPELVLVELKASHGF